MRFVLLCAALAAAPAMAGDLVARKGTDMVHLADQPCTSELVLARLDTRLQLHYKAASAVVQGQKFVACWRMAGHAVYLMYEDGDEGLIPLSELKPELTA